MMINSIYVDNIIKTALLEDINYLDTTTDYLIDENQENTAKFLAKNDGVLCGLEIALRVFEILQPTGFEVKIYKHDGDKLQKGDIIAEVHGKTRTILKGERTALNLIQHMSGIATATNKAVEIIKGTNASIADTRKTLPGMRPLQKYAVTVGAGINHQAGLRNQTGAVQQFIGTDGQHQTPNNGNNKFGRRQQQDQQSGNRHRGSHNTCFHSLYVPPKRRLRR